jgi:hypothetical protein
MRLAVSDWERIHNIARGQENPGAPTSISEEFWRTLCCDLEFVPHENGFRRLSDILMSEDMYREWRFSNKDSNRRTSLINNHWLKPIRADPVKEWINVYNHVLGCTSGGRAFFMTERGHIGIGSPDAQVGDVVSVLLGSRVPFILRPDGTPRKCTVDEGQVLFIGQFLYAGAGAKIESLETFICCDTHQNCYCVVGDAYVDGAMDGEVTTGEFQTIGPSVGPHP